MNIDSSLIENLTQIAARFAEDAAVLNPEAVVALEQQYGEEGVLAVSVEFKAGRPRYCLDHIAPDGSRNAIFSVEGISGAEIEKEKNSLH